MNYYLTLLKDTAIIGFGNMFSKGILFILVPLYTSSMCKADYGLAELLFNIVNVLMPVFTLGIAEAAMRFSIDNEDKRKSIFQIVTTLPILGAITICLLSIPLLGKYPVYKEYFVQILVLYLCFSLKDIYLYFSKGINDLKLFSLGSICFSIALFVSTYYLVVVEKTNIDGYLNAYILANFFTVVYLWYYGKFAIYCDFSVKYFDKALLREMLVYSAPLMTNVLAWWVTNLSNRYILAYYASLEEVGIYSATAKFASILTALFGVFFQAWQINSAKHINVADRKCFFSKVHSYYIMSIILGSVIVMPLAIFIVPYFIRSNFMDAYRYLPYVLITGTAGCLPMYWGAIYGALKDTKGAFYSTVCGSMASILFNFLLIPKYGIYGAVVATIISYFIVTAYRIVDINKIINIDLDLQRHLVSMLILFIQAAAFTYCEGFFVLSLTNCGVLLLLMLIYKKYIGGFVTELKKLVKKRSCSNL